MKLENQQFLKDLKNLDVIQKAMGAIKAFQAGKRHNYIYICDDSFSCNVRNDLGEEGSIFSKETCQQPPKQEKRELAMSLQKCGQIKEIQEVESTEFGGFVRGGS